MNRHETELTPDICRIALRAQHAILRQRSGALTSNVMATTLSSMERRSGWLDPHQLPGGLLRAGSTDADWVQHTVVPTQANALREHRSQRDEDPRHSCRRVIVEHTITAHDDNVDFRLTAHNPTSKRSEAHWAQPCVRLGGLPASRRSLAAIWRTTCPNASFFLKANCSECRRKIGRKRLATRPSGLVSADVPGPMSIRALSQSVFPATG